MDFWNVSEMDYFNCRDPFDGKEPSFSRGLANSRNPLQGRLSRAHHACGRTASQGPGLSSAPSDLVAPLRFSRGQGFRRLRPTWSCLVLPLRRGQGCRRLPCRLGRVPTASQGPGLSSALSDLVASLCFSRGQGFRRHRPTWSCPAAAAAPTPETRALVGFVRPGRVSTGLTFVGGCQLSCVPTGLTFVGRCQLSCVPPGLTFVGGCQPSCVPFATVPGPPTSLGVLAKLLLDGVAGAGWRWQ